MAGNPLPPLNFLLLWPRARYRFSLLKRFFCARPVWFPVLALLKLQPTQPSNSLNTNTLTPTVAAATLASAHAGNHNLSTGPKRMAYEAAVDLLKTQDVKLRSGAGVGMARVAQFILGQTDIHECVPFLINRDNVI